MSDVALNLEGYFPFYLGTISNRWTSSSSRLYLDRYGIGIGEWRVLASISALGSASSQQVVALIMMDPGAVSRSVKRLEAGDLIEPVNGRFVGRTKPYRLTPAGQELYAKISEIALDREATLLALLTPEEQKELIRLLAKVVPQLENL
jgi:DNA-binding MarR family transcriptional regulator